MAAVLITTINNYVGTAAERAAMATTGLPAGSTFYETDTKDTYIWGGAAWTVKADDVQFIAGTAIIGFTGTVNADGATKINPAKEDGNLATVATGVGAPADAAYAGGAAASIIAGLKGIYTKLGAVALAAGTAIIGKVGIEGRTTALAGSKTVTAAGTPEALGSQAVGEGVYITPLVTNTGAVYVFPAAGAKTDVIALYPGDTDFWPVSNISALKIDSDVNGEGAYWKAAV